MKTVADIRHVLHLSADRDNPMVRRFLALEGKERIECAGDGELRDAADRLRREGVPSKEVLILKEFPGRLFQKCPGSPGMICCNYLLINTGFNCLYNCTYCYLNSYLNSYGIVQFINTGRMTAEIDLHLAERKDGRVMRIGTGEFTDSLMMDEVTGICAELADRYAGEPGLMLEFKTKSDNIGHLLDLPRRGNTVLAWSLNTVRNIARYEEGSADLERRLAAAGRACGAGYLLAFHFDPVILRDGWEVDYERVMDLLFESVDPERIAWISLGGFRHSPGFRECIAPLFPDEDLTAAELFPGKDGKFRYLKSVRVAMYRHMAERIRDRAGKTFLYLCMESREVWRDVFGKEYGTSDDLEQEMSDHLKREFCV